MPGWLKLKAEAEFRLNLAVTRKHIWPRDLEPKGIGQAIEDAEYRAAVDGLFDGRLTYPGVPNISDILFLVDPNGRGVLRSLHHSPCGRP